MFRKALLLMIAFALPAPTVHAADVTLQAPDGTNVTIYRDEYGVPHIVGDTEVGVFYGQGYAVARDRLYQMELSRRGAQGRLAEWMGIFAAGFDKEARLTSYTEAERTEMFNALPEEMRVSFESYAQGVNTYIDSMNANPERLKPKEFQYREMEPWDVNKSIAIIEYMTRNFGGFGGSELDRLAELQEHGQDWFDENRPINDPTAPVTIQGGGSPVSRQWHYSGMHVRNEVIQSIRERREATKSFAESLGLPTKLGSFAVLSTPQFSTSGHAMLLGCPQMGRPEHDVPQVNHEVELHCPTLHVGGITIAGVPMVIIGHTEYAAWSLTSGYSDNIDIYVETTQDSSFSKYLYNGAWLDFETIMDTIHTSTDDVLFTHYRTIHGPVFADDLSNRQVFSAKPTFWKHEMDMGVFLNASIRATNLEEFDAAVAINPMSFNVVYAGKDQHVKYWHSGWYQDRSDGVDPRLPHNGDGSEEWGGLRDFSTQPQAQDPPQGYFVNWNNKPVSWWDNGDNIPWVGPHRVDAMYTYITPFTRFSYDDLKNTPVGINAHGTYQQAIEFAGDEIIDENIVPPGQSAFISLEGEKSPHFNDQWPLHEAWQFKDMRFGEFATSVGRTPQTPVTFSLSQNYPNPYLAKGGQRATIGYTLPIRSRVVLDVYDVMGRKVRRLVDEMRNPGRHIVTWDASGLPSGMYVYRIRAGAFQAARKSLVIR